MTYDVVIIGSGYGGSVVAARLAGRARVLLVERGRRYQPGDFPKSLLQLIAAYRRPRRTPLGLWSLRLGEGTGNAIASGLGGGSLLNYGITERPPARVLGRWALDGGTLEPYIERARTILAPEANPRRHELRDAAFLDRLEPGRRQDLENTIDWQRCTFCGNCVSGCNEGAKRSLDRTYLPLAEGGGLDISTETEVLRVEPHPGERGKPGYRLVLRPSRGGAAVELFSRRVVLSAGCFGSLDLLMTHRDALPTSERLGRGMSMNGDALFFLYNSEAALSGEHGAPLSTTARFEIPGADGEPRGVTVISGRLPKFLMPLAGRSLPLLSRLLPGRGQRGGNATLWRQFRDLSAVAAGGALANTFMYKLDGEDAAEGRGRLDDDGQVVMDWPGYRDDPVLRFGRERLAGWAAVGSDGGDSVVGGRLIDEPSTWPLLGGRAFGVHPLGGCNLGADPGSAVVDRELRLFRPDGGVYPGLRVVDASVIPTALGVPPSLTIAALAERAAEGLLAEIDADR